MGMGIAERIDFDTLKRQVTEQQHRIEVLEAALRTRPPPSLGPHNAARQAAAQRLDEWIAHVLAAHAEPSRLTAKQVGRALERAGFDRVVPERTLRRHLKSVRGQRPYASGHHS